MFSIIVFLVVLGELILIHELGHFLAAKFFGVYVDRFSLGMPPRIFGLRLGETDYCIGALPIGGYVKMAGQEDAPLSEDEREKTYGHVPPERWFNRKPVWQRMCIIAAGPFMNLVLGIVLYAIVAGVGANVPETKYDNRIGVVAEESPAADAPLYLADTGGAMPDMSGGPDAVGWQTGDRILRIDGAPITNIMDVAFEAVVGKGDTHLVEIERTGPDGQKALFVSPVKPVISDDSEYPRFGIGAFTTALVGEIEQASPAESAGMRAGDIIERADGKLVDVPTFIETVSGLTAGETLQLTLLNGDERREVTVTPKTVGGIEGVYFAPSDQPNPRMDAEAGNMAVVVDVDKSAVPDVGLLPKDYIVAVNGEPVTAEQLFEFEKQHPGTEAELTVLRPAVLGGLYRDEDFATAQVDIVPKGVIGVQFIEKMIFHRVPPLEVVPAAFGLAWRDVTRIMVTIKELFTGDVRTKDLGGPIMIYTATTQAARMGISWLLEMVAFISINLFIFNLLPLPVLDGGLMAMLTFEGIRGKPISVKVAERIQQVGVLLIIALIVMVTYNDILRLFQQAIPS